MLTVFGKDEDGGFEFKQVDIDHIITGRQSMLTNPALIGYPPNLSPTFLDALAFLCISDVTTHAIPTPT